MAEDAGAAAQGPDDRPVILLVDDQPENLQLLGELLCADYRVRAVTSGQAALRAAMSLPRPDLVILDVMMPDMDGYETFRQLQALPGMADIPVIFATALADASSEEKALALGAADYLSKPLRPRVVQVRVKAQIQALQARRWHENRESELRQEVQARLRDFSLVQDVALRTLASLVETRDNETGNHILRTQAYVEALGKALLDHPRYAPLLQDGRLAVITKAAPLHDIGKVGIPDSILLKPSVLTPEEFSIMKQHAALGRNAIEKALEEVRNEVGAPDGLHFEFLEVGRDIAGYHHERWDGSGYPFGLAGEDIPVPARLMALADVYDALISRRVYKAALPHWEAVKIIEAGSGQHFDPEVVLAFQRCSSQFVDISERYRDEEGI